ncbi:MULTISPECIES: chloride channel protein [Gemella]|uniref:chloride channel protein n=1 Tax=Gemella TaxID=1378 RepID=UPI000B16B7A0|nr:MULTISPECIES: chloride channel protein [Gemella]
MKLLLTVICTAVGFSGGEVTPLFAIGASFGVVLSGALGLPIYILAGIGYSLVFSSATKSFLTPILLVLEVFGIKLMLLASLSALIIYFINRKYSIYE